MKGVTQLGRVDPGIDAHGVFTARVSLPAAEYSDAGRSHDFLAQLQSAVASLPGVSAVGFVNFLPLTNSGSTTWVSSEDLVLGEGERPPTSIYYVVQGDYFAALDVTITRGRVFEAADADREAPRVVMVSERLATQLWPNEDPIGKRIKLGRPDDETAWRTVVGVTADLLHWGLHATAWPSLYLPGAQARSLSNSLVARVDGDPSSYAEALRTQLRGLDANLPAYEFSDMASLVERSTWQPVLYSWMFGVFATMAISLAAIGLYGVVAFSVGQRTREMGIRVALGAPRHGVVLLVVRQSMAVVWIGITAGLAGSFALSGVLSKIVFGVDTTDLGVYASVAGLLAVVALCATLIPSRRATRIDPMRALRAD